MMTSLSKTTQLFAINFQRTLAEFQLRFSFQHLVSDSILAKCELRDVILTSPLVAHGLSAVLFIDTPA